MVLDLHFFVQLQKVLPGGVTYGDYLAMTAEEAQALMQAAQEIEVELEKIREQQRSEQQARESFNNLVDHYRKGGK